MDGETTGVIDGGAGVGGADADVTECPGMGQRQHYEWTSVHSADGRPLNRLQYHSTEKRRPTRLLNRRHKVAYLRGEETASTTSVAVPRLTKP